MTNKTDTLTATDTTTIVTSMESGWLYKIEVHEVKNCSSEKDLSAAIRKILTTPDGKVVIHAVIHGRSVKPEHVKLLVGQDLKHLVF